MGPVGAALLAGNPAPTGAIAYSLCIGCDSYSVTQTDRGRQRVTPVGVYRPIGTACDTPRVSDDLLGRVRDTSMAAARHAARRDQLDNTLNTALALALAVAKRDEPRGGPAKVTAATVSKNRPEGLTRMTVWRRSEKASDVTPGADDNLTDLLAAVTKAGEALARHDVRADDLREQQYAAVRDAGQAARNGAYPASEIVRATRSQPNAIGLQEGLVYRLIDEADTTEG